MKFIERYCNFINFNFFAFVILWFLSAVPLQSGKFTIVINILIFIMVIYIIFSKVLNKINNVKLVNFLRKSPLNLVIGSLGTGKTALMVFVSQLMKKKKYKISATFPLEQAQKLSLGHMSLLDTDYPVLPEKSLLLWDESNLFLEGTDHKLNDKITRGLQEYFALVRHFDHIVLVSGQRPEHIWVKVRDIANSIIVGVRVKPVRFYRNYLKVIYASFKSVSEYERWRETLILAKNSKKMKRIKYRDIPELDIYFFKLKIPMSILNLYNSKYLRFLRDVANRTKDYKDYFYYETEIDLSTLDYLKMDKFSNFLRDLKNNQKEGDKNG